MPQNQAILQISNLQSDGFLAVCDELCFVLQEMTLCALRETIADFLAEEYENFNFNLPKQLEPGTFILN